MWSCFVFSKWLLNRYICEEKFNDLMRIKNE